MAQARRKHLFEDCGGFDWRATERDRRLQTTADISRCTCGTCKTRVLNVLLSKDWGALSRNDEACLLEALDEARRRTAEREAELAADE
jgi:hypothetical protein